MPVSSRNRKRAFQPRSMPMTNFDTGKLVRTAPPDLAKFPFHLGEALRAKSQSVRQAYRKGCETKYEMQ
ncbi:hypothetical protein GCM10010990_36400 [Croceicoccus mobilis]|uniref:Uncharacterized protein n=1 Tax=Croceicoccus mobilis TaxID=1703339 RepID=A0A917DZR5_9SPHN|nr:hypothetical protein GCM10010990_36400 [Croceicoccus mobilis]